MKKILFAIAIVLTIGFSASAQSNKDSFVDWESEWGGSRTTGYTPGLPWAAVGINSNVTADPAPLGSGLLVLTALGAGYAVVKKRKK